MTAPLPAFTEDLLEFLYLMPVAVVKFRADGSVVLINSAAAALLLPLPGGSELGNLFVALAAVAEDLPRQIATFAAVEGTVIDQQWLSSMIEGRMTVLSLTVVRIGADAYMAVMSDVTLTAEQDRALFADRGKFQAIFDQLRQYAIYTLDLDGKIDEWNRSLERFGGWDADQVLGLPFSMFWPPGEFEPSTVEELLRHARDLGSVETESWHVKRDGSRLWANTVVSALRDNASLTVGYVVVSRDITDRKMADDELQKLANLDPLTGAFNRRQGDVLILAEVALQARDQRPFSALMLDIDDFKTINDRFGHAAGDSVLTGLTGICRQLLRSVDMVIRWGGDEFLVLLPGADAKAAFSAAERVRSALADSPVALPGGGSAGFTVSIGGAQSAGGDAGDLIRRADQALYAAKAAGRDQVRMAARLRRSTPWRRRTDRISATAGFDAAHKASPYLF